MKLASLIIALVAGMGWAAFADQPVAKPAAKQKAMRDPFWPVSYNVPARQPETAGSPAEASAPSIRWPELPVRGSSRGPDGSYFVLIEGTGVVRPGEVVSIFKDNLWFHWQISGIDAFVAPGAPRL